MKIFVKRFILSCALFCASLVVAAVSYASPADEVKVQVNDELVSFPDAQPFLEKDSVLQVPLRFLSEKLGYEVEWSMIGTDQVSIKLKNKEQTIDLSTGGNHAIVNGSPESLDGMAIFSEGRTYVPLRFIAETFGSPVRWDSDNQIAIIETDGKTHKPAWIAPKPVESEKPVQPDKKQQIIQTANTFIGVPYVWGGTSPQGFDCSGFVRYVFQNKGISLPRTSAQMHSQVGTPVKDLQAGDLVFFANSSVDHVGIYIGDGKFISSTSSNGVRVDKLLSGYWGARYVGAKRVL
ncbi:C40 family peptidase [Paenibacillus eucommiae]|uniref:Peptidoglycan endopeptidase LytE n=1 Tax=Paenibacillus eucommiae TaxID=1355755 RepID=A0ABS4ITI6_9BACL|nr:NlpC/P60 family protein [Paenibacillus eucommiae]MBP1990882.1 peptidoglycan endopeptidase LytE [Paenibacillus eucommiae]